METSTRNSELPVDKPRSRRLGPSAVVTDAPKGPPWHDAMLRTRHADISLRQTSGKKLPILLMHGGGLGKNVFDRQLESSLGGQHRMIAIDLPGHGASSDAFDPDRTYRIEGLADLAVEVLERLGIDNAVVVGASLGGRVGLEMIRTFPGLIGLVLTGTPLRGTNPTAPAGLPEFEFSAGKLFGDREFLRLSLGNVDLSRFAPAVERADGRALDLICHDIRSKAESWPTAVDVSATPILAVNGELGPIVNTGRQAGGRRAQTCFSIPQAGPAPYLAAPTIYNHLIERFMERMARRQRRILASPPTWYGG